MAGTRCNVLDLRELLRRLRLEQGHRAIARDMGIGRNTVRSYAALFARHGLVSKARALASAEELQKLLDGLPSAPTTMPRLAAYRDEVAALVGAPLQKSVAWQRFLERHPDLRISYWTFCRFVRRHVRPVSPEAVLRLEVAAGAEAQVDFGYAGLMPRAVGEVPRKTWVFVMTLSHSRHQYVEFVQDQCISTWLALHEHAFASFGGVPRKVVLDNLKAGIIKASITDPAAQRSYRDCAEHYGFVMSPCVPRTPKHKGKVERGVQYVKCSLLAGRAFPCVSEANRAAREWVNTTAGTRTHGTTHERPLVAFQQREAAALLPLPTSGFAVPEYKEVTLYRDCHVAFDGAYYSVPHTLIGERIWIRATAHAVQILHHHALIATHARATELGQRVQDTAHFPKDKLRYFTEHPDWCRAQAVAVGPHTRAFVDRLLDDKTMDRLRGAQAVLRLRKKFGDARLERACHRALVCDAVAVTTLKSILTHHLDSEPLPDYGPRPHSTRTYAFARDFGGLFAPTSWAPSQGGQSWILCMN
jgi:transposase